MADDDKEKGYIPPDAELAEDVEDDLVPAESGMELEDEKEAEAEIATQIASPVRPSFAERAGQAVGYVGPVIGGGLAKIGEGLEGRSPTEEANGDDLSDLFRAPSENDPDMQTDDLLEVDLYDDVLDGDLEDLTEVTEEDIMGPEDPPPPPKPPRRLMRRTSKRYEPPSMGGMRY